MITTCEVSRPRKIAAGEGDAGVLRGPEKSAEKGPAVEFGRRGQRKEGVFRQRAHRREIRKVHRQRTFGRGFAARSREKVHAFDLGVHGDRQILAHRDFRGVVAQQLAARR